MSAEPRIFIIAGHYGSGKTEVAINYAISVSASRKTALVDLDTVNPYYRSREAKEMLAEQGISVVAPAGEAIHADIPALSPLIAGVIENEDYYTILDVGGDDQGARALGRFQPRLTGLKYEMALVVNPYRPFTGNTAAIARMLQDIETASRLKVGSLIANPHLGEETCPDNISEGLQLIQESAKHLNLPIKFVSIEESLYRNSETAIEGYKILPLKLFNSPPWLKRG